MGISLRLGYFALFQKRKEKLKDLKINNSIKE